MRYYPLFLDLTDKRCLVVGAGQVGRRKIKTLLDCGAAHVLVIDTCTADQSMRTLLDHPNLTFECREFLPEDLKGKSLVIACTSSEETNWEISRLCAKQNILCNIVDQPEKCSFILPALFTRGDLTLAVSTSGKSPALCKKIRRDLAHSFGPEYEVLTDLMGRLRPMVLELGYETSRNTKLFSAIVHSGILEAIQSKEKQNVLDILQSSLPRELHSRLEDLVNDYF